MKFMNMKRFASTVMAGALTLSLQLLHRSLPPQTPGTRHKPPWQFLQQHWFLWLPVPSQ